MRRDLLVCDWQGDDDTAWSLMGPLCALTGALPVVRLDPGPGETVVASGHGPATTLAHERETNPFLGDLR